MKKISLILFLAVIIFGVMPGYLLGHMDNPVKGKAIAGKATWYTDSILSTGGNYVDGDFAAMRNVPIGTKVIVTALRTGRSIMVTVNDFGPSEEMSKKGRIIDLTRNAFLKLEGSLKAGEINVLVEARDAAGT